MELDREYLNIVLSEKERIKEILLDFLYRQFGKHFTLEERIKSIDKIKMKQQLIGNDDIHAIGDIIGFRISVDSDGDVLKLISIFNKWIDKERMIFDYFNRPKETGFKAYLIQFRNNFIPYEIQIMTKKMRDWTNKTHAEHDKRKYNNLR